MSPSERPGVAPSLPRPLSSTLGKLVAEEASESRSSSELWLERWVGADAGALTPAFHAALVDAVPVFAQFRRVLRNFAIGHHLEAGVVSIALEPGRSPDAALREQLRLCYLFILCRAAAHHPFWEQAYQQFLEDDLKLFGIPSPGAREGPVDDKRLKAIVVDIATDVHSWITTSYSTHGVAAPWPMVPELNLHVLLSRPGNFRCNALGPYDGNVHEYLLPALAALRRYGTDGGKTRLESLRKQQLAALREGTEFRRLVAEATRLSDERRQVFLRLYAMTIERVLWLAEETSRSEDVAQEVQRNARDLADLGRKMDRAIETGRYEVVAKSATPLAEWVSEDLKQRASERVRRSGRKRRSHDRMVPPPPGVPTSPVAMPISVQISAGRAGAVGNEFAIRVPEHELPGSVRWYEMEFATYVTRTGSAAHLTRLPVIASEPTMSEKGLQRWATYNMELPDANASLLPGPESVTNCGAAWKATPDGRGAYVLVIVGEASRKHEDRTPK